MVASHSSFIRMVCVVCSCCATSPYRKGGIWSGETFCHDIYLARSITTVSLAIDDRPGIQQEAICYQWFKQRLIMSVFKPSISQQSQIK